MSPFSLPLSPAQRVNTALIPSGPPRHTQPLPQDHHGSSPDSVAEALHPRSDDVQPTELLTVHLIAWMVATNAFFSRCMLGNGGEQQLRSRRQF